jgi:hypothetical protein
MCKALLKRYSIALLTIAKFAPPAVNGVNRKKLPQGDDHARIIKEVRHELATLPYYGVFDWFEYEVRPDNTVVLRGCVVRPTTKSDAEARARKIPGVTHLLLKTIVYALSSIVPSTTWIRRSYAMELRPFRRFPSSSRTDERYLKEESTQRLTPI